MADVAPVSMCLNAGGMGRIDAESETLIATTGGGFDVAHSLKAEGFDASEDGTGRGTPIVPVVIQERAICENPDAGPDGAGFRQDGAAYTLEARTVPQAVAFAQNTRDEIRLLGGDGQTAGALAAEPGMKQQTFIQQAWAVRRLTPTECERLQGFPDGYTSLADSAKPQADGPRYKQLGNSMAVNCMTWIGRRIEMVEAATKSESEAA